jgi:hypothetical protein
MKNNNLKLKIFSFSLLFFAFSFSLLANAQAAPEFLISWRAFNYVPADYQGKIFPVNGTLIKVSFDLIDNGKIADLSKHSISWFLNGDLFQSGKGSKTIIFNSKDGNQQIRINVADYRGTDVEKIIFIPVVRPEAIIDARFSSSEITIGRYRLEAKPYFFNIFDLSGLTFNWFLNGELLTGSVARPQFLELNLESAGAPQKTNLLVSVNVINKNERLESASKILNLTVIP